MKVNVVLDCKIEVPFCSYNNKKLDRKAIASIKRHVKETLRNELNYMSLCVEKDDTGATIEDSAGQVKVSIQATCQ